MRKDLLVVMMTMILLTAVPAVCNADSGMTTPEELQARMLAGEKEIVVYTEGRDAAGLVSRAASMDEAENPAYEGSTSKGDYLREAVLRKVKGHPGTWDANKACYKTTLYLYYKMDKDQLAFVEETVDKVVSRCSDLPDPDKVRFFCDWLAAHITYAEPDSVYQTLSEGKGQCREYSVLLYLFCKEAGLDVRTVTGIYDGLLHEWNIVRINDAWYNVDATFYDHYVGETRYVLKGSRTFSIDHELLETLQKSDFAEHYPVSETDYVSQSDAPVVTELVCGAYTCVALSIL